MAAAACRRWLADYHSGIDSVLLTITNAQATELARRARDELAVLGLVATDDLVELADGAGVGDLIVARQNVRIWAGEADRRLANRDVLRIDAWDEIGEERVALVRRVTGRDARTGEVQWSAPFELPRLTSSSTSTSPTPGTSMPPMAGRSATGHLVVDETAGREWLYVGMTRGRYRNIVYVVVEPARAADLAPRIRPAPAIQDPADDKKKNQRPDRPSRRASTATSRNSRRCTRHGG